MNENISKNRDLRAKIAKELLSLIVLDSTSEKEFFNNYVELDFAFMTSQDENDNPCILMDDFNIALVPKDSENKELWRKLFDVCAALYDVIGLNGLTAKEFFNKYIKQAGKGSLTETEDGTPCINFDKFSILIKPY